MTRIFSIAVFAVMAFAVSPAMAQTQVLNYATTPGWTTDNAKTPAGGTASFSINGSGQLVVVVTNTEIQPYEDSQNIDGIGFTLQTYSGTYLTTATLASISGSTISSTPLNTNVSGLITANGASIGTTPWSATDTVTPNNSLTNIASHQITEFSFVGTPGSMQAKYSIVAPAAGSPLEYTVPASNCLPNCGTGQEFGSNTDDDPMIYGTATFVFNVTGVTATSVLGNSTGGGDACLTSEICIDNVAFGFGPDGPDGDDVTALNYSSTTIQTAAPEPASMSIFGLGVASLAFFRRQRRRAAIDGFVPGERA